MILVGWLIGYLARRKTYLDKFFPTQKRAECEGLTFAKKRIDHGKPGVF